MVPIARESERREENKKGDIGKSLKLETLADHLRRRIKILVTRSIPRRKPRVEEEREMKKMKNEEREKNDQRGKRVVSFQPSLEIWRLGENRRPNEPPNGAKPF